MLPNLPVFHSSSYLPLASPPIHLLPLASSALPSFALAQSTLLHLSIGYHTRRFITKSQEVKMQMKHTIIVEYTVLVYLQ